MSFEFQRVAILIDNAHFVFGNAIGHLHIDLLRDARLYIAKQATEVTVYFVGDADHAIGIEHDSTVETCDLSPLRNRCDNGHLSGDCLLVARLSHA